MSDSYSSESLDARVRKLEALVGHQDAMIAVLAEIALVGAIAKGSSPIDDPLKRFFDEVDGQFWKVVDVRPDGFPDDTGARKLRCVKVQVEKYHLALAACNGDAACETKANDDLKKNLKRCQ